MSCFAQSLFISRANILFDGAKECTMNFLGMCFVGTEELKPKLQKSIDSFLPVFDKVGVICRITPERRNDQVES